MSRQVRIPIENETMMKVFQPAVSQSMDAIPDGSKILFHGFANIGNCDSSYFITYHGIYYCEQERRGLLKKKYVPRFFDLDRVEKVGMDDLRDQAYVRFFGEGKMLLVMWFKPELSAFRRMTAEEEAMRFVEKYGT